MSIQLSFKNSQFHFRPGEWLEGDANWNLTAPPQGIEFRLIWFTRGKGNRDIQIVETVPITTRAAMGDAPFRFRLPEAPHSFSGSLVSLVWAVEAVVLPSQTSTRFEFVLSPTGEEIALPKIEQPTSPFASSTVPGWGKQLEAFSNRRIPPR